MKTPARLALIGVACGLVSACSHAPIPVSENFPYTIQKKVRSAGHWDLLSRDAIVQTTTRLAAAGVTKGASLSVELPLNPTTFDRAFNDFLITELVKAGYSVPVDPKAAATRLSYRTQLVRHESARPHFVPGKWTALTAGLYVLHGLAIHASTTDAMAGGLGFAGLADLVEGQYSGGPTSFELILTTTVESQGRYVVRQSDVYYVEQADLSLFTPAAAVQSKSMKVVDQ